MTMREKLDLLSKVELAELMDSLSKKVDSGRCTGADVQTLRLAVEIYLEKFDR